MGEAQSRRGRAIAQSHAAVEAKRSRRAQKGYGNEAQGTDAAAKGAATHDARTRFGQDPGAGTRNRARAQLPQSAGSHEDAGGRRNATHGGGETSRGENESGTHAAHAAGAGHARRDGAKAESRAD